MLWVPGSNYGGWSFNLDDYAELNSFPYPVPLSFLLANGVSEQQLRMKPFFTIGANDAALFNEFTGSNYAMRPEVQNRLLAEAIPARTLASGRTIINVFNKPGLTANFDMQINYQNGWPVVRLRENYYRWLHSDFYKVALPYVYRLYDSFVAKGGLK